MNITDALEPFFAGEMSLEDALNDTTEMFYKALAENTFVCEVCGETIMPKITTNEHGIFIDSARAEIRGGLGNKVLKRNVCEGCLKRMNFTNEEWFCEIKGTD